MNKKYRLDLWNTKRGTKNLHRITKYNKGINKRNKNIDSGRIIKINHSRNIFNEEVFIVPKNFSIRDNSEEAISFFNNVMKYSNTTDEKYGRIRFVLKNVQHVTVDAIMYLIAVMNNIRTKCNAIEYRGDMPYKDDVKQLFIESGFFERLSIKNRYTGKINNKNSICIRTGKQVDNDVIKSLCDFVDNRIKIKSKTKRALYQTFIELMSNTYNHAYDEDDNLERVWYVYAKKEKRTVYFTFLDTGKGIADTIYKKQTEKFFEYLKLKKEFELTLSAFTGTYRSETKELKRGTGLPEIYMHSKTHLSNMKVITDKSYCNISPNENGKNLNNHLHGTVYVWEIHEEEKHI